jgi:phosphoribosylformylglycinamidine synthase
MKFGVVVFPGSNGDEDITHVLSKVMGLQTVKLWHKETDLSGFNHKDCIILPGGASFGDYLRPGALAARAPIMPAIIDYAAQGGYLWGIGNGFQILCEAGLLPGALLPNSGQRFLCRNVHLKVATNNAAITANVDTAKPLKIPIAHAAGRYYVEEELLAALHAGDQILFQYCTENGTVDEVANPNGSLESIAGICNRERNVFGMMPRPERAAEAVLGNTDGRVLFESILAAARLNG